MTTPTTPNLFTPPPKYNLPISKGGDLAVDFLNDPNENGTYVDYDAGVTVTLIIDTTPPIEAPATISGHHAVVKIESAVTDAITSTPAPPSWRVVVSTPTTPTTEVVAANGKVKRFDG